MSRIGSGGASYRGIPPGGHQLLKLQRGKPPFTMTARLDPKNAKAVLGILIGHALDQSGEHLPILWRQPGFGLLNDR